MSTLTAVQQKDMTFGLMGQPNTGKSTVFNALTGSRQHVGNWPGKTVERKDGVFSRGQRKYTLVDLPGTYSLSANSEEEIITRQYIVDDNADMVFALVDASQLERSMFLLSDFAEINRPAVVLLNMVDVAKEQGKAIDAGKLSEALGVPVLPVVASQKEGLEPLYRFLDGGRLEGGLLDTSGLEEKYWQGFGPVFSELAGLLSEYGDDACSSMWLTVKLLEGDRAVSAQVEQMTDAGTWRQIEKLLENQKDGILIASDCKFQWLHEIVEQSVATEDSARPVRSRFDRLATSKRWGKPIAVGIILGGLILSMLIGFPLMGVIGVIQGFVVSGAEAGLTSIGVHAALISLICDAILSGAFMALNMVAYVFGISLVFGFMEELGYMARISYVFDSAMQRLGLHGKAVMPFLISFGCNIGGVAGTRVIDSWKQRLLAIATSWVVPCAGVWAVIGLMGTVFFGSGAVLVVLALFATAVLHMFITSRIFGRSLNSPEDRTGLIMELPPYHKPNKKTLLRFVWQRMKDVLVRALKLIVLVSVAFWLLSYSPGGDITSSVLYKVGTFIEPVTMFFGLSWELFAAFLVSGLGKEASLGVISALFNVGGGGAVNLFGLAMGSASYADPNLSMTLAAGVSQAQALAFMFGFFFNMPCIIALGATASETHSAKWTARIALYYVGMALVMAGIAYRIGLLIF